MRTIGKKRIIVVVLACMYMLQGCADRKQNMQEWITPQTEVKNNYQGRIQTSARGETEESDFSEAEFAAMQVSIPLTSLSVDQEGFIDQDGKLMASTQAIETVMGLRALESEDGNGIYGYNENTCFFDSNSLLCINAKIEILPDQNACMVEKTYYYDQKIYREREQYPIDQVVLFHQDGQTYVSVDMLAKTYGYQLVWDRGNKTGTIGGGGRAAGNYQNKCYEQMPFELEVGSFWSTTGMLTSASQGLGIEYGKQFVYTAPDQYIPVREGDEFRMNFFYSWFSQVAGILFLDAADQPVLYYTSDKSTQIEDQIVTAPAGAVKMHLSLYTNQTYKMEKVVYMTGAQLDQIPKSFYQQQSIAIMRANQRDSMSQYSGEYPLDKAYITFVADDCRPDLEQVYKLFQEKNIPLSAAVITSRLPFVSANGQETNVDVCRRLQAEGGEILAHSDLVITADMLDDYDRLFEHFFENKMLLALYGLDASGIVLSGGEDLVRSSDVTDYWVRQFYDYSDLYGVEALKEPYYHPRISLDYHYESYKQLVDQAIADKKWLVFYLHSVDEVGETQLRQALDYVNEQGKNRIEAITYKDLYNLVR